MIATVLSTLRGYQLASGKSGQRYALDVIAASVPSFILKLRGIVLISVLVRLLGLEQYGIWIQLTVVTKLFGFLGTLGLHSSLIRFFPECKSTQEKTNLIFSVVLLTTILSSIVVAIIWFLSPVITLKLFGPTAPVGLMRLASFLVPMGALDLVFLTVLRAQNNIRTYATLKSLFGIGDLLSIVFVAFFFRSLHLIILAQILTLLFTNLFLVTRFLREWDFFPLSLASPSALRRYLSYSLPTLPTGFSDEVAARADRLLIGLFVGPAAVGAYSIVYAMASILMLFNSPIVDVFFPKLAHLKSAGHHERGLKYTRVTLLAMGLISLALSAVISLFGRVLWLLLAGPQSLLISESTLPGLLILAGLGITLFGLSRILIITLYVNDRTPLIPVIYAITAAVNVVLNLLLIPTFGLWGAAVATLISYCVMAGTTFTAARRSRMI